MFKITVLALFVASVSCVDVVEVSGNKGLPVRAGSGISSVSGINNVRQVVPVGQSVVSRGFSGFSPVVSSYGVSGVDGFNGINSNLQYLRDLRARVFGSSPVSYLGGSYLSGYQGNSFNIAPSTLNYGQNLFAFQRPAAAFLHQPAPYAISQPGFAVAHQPVAQHLTIAQPQVAIAHQPSIAVARPQVYAGQSQVYAAQNQVHPVNAAITQVARTVEYRPVPYQDQPIVPQEVVVEPSDQPINIHFRSRSSTVRITSDHIPGEPGEVIQTNSQDEPSRVQHEVVKPVVQEVKEIIQPYRQVTQEIQPVVENVHTVVAHGEGQRQQYLAEPVVRQQVAVRPAVQQLAVQQVAVPQVQEVRVQQPHYFAVSQPAIQSIGVQHVVPQVQTLSVAQPVVSSYIQPNLNFDAYRSVSIAQPVVGVNRVVSVQQPRAVVRDVVQPSVEVRQQGGNFVRYAESDDD